MRFITIVLAVYFFLLSFAPNMQGAQLLNLSSFIEHYEDYLQTKSGSSLITFVKEHYFSQINEFDKEHKNLPFKTVSTNAIVVYTCEQNTIKITPFEEVVFSTKKEKFTVYEEAYNFNKFHSVWHPPRNC
jgi:hypothetical protein